MVLGRGTAWTSWSTNGIHRNAASRAAVEWKWLQLSRYVWRERGWTQSVFVKGIGHKRLSAFRAGGRWPVALLLLLPGVLAGQASGSVTTQHVKVGAIAGMGGEFLPRRYLGLGV